MISLLLVLALVVGICPAALAGEVVAEPKMVDIELEINDEYVVVVSVPENKAEEYRQRLENDPAFRQSEIDTALAFMNPTRQRPEGNVVYEKYMYEEDFKKAADDSAGEKVYDAWKKACGDVIEASDILALVNRCGVTTAMALCAHALNVAINVVASYQEAWWKESCALICDGEISAVRYLIIESVVEYPKAWRVFERVS